MKKVLGVVFGSMKWLWRMLFVSVFAFSLAFNVFAVLGGAVFQAVSGAFENVTGAKTLLARHADEVADLSASVASQNREVERLEDELKGKNTRINSLTDELEEARAERVVTYRNQKRFLTEAVEDTSDRIAKRTVNRSARNVTAVFAEAIPVVGVGVVVGVTGLELRDSCNTLKDLKELELSFNPTATAEDDVQQVCGLEVPSRDEVWQTVRASPTQAWEAMKLYLPDLGELNLPRLPFWWN